MATTFAESIKEMMSNWDRIVAAAKSQNPGASDETIFRIASAAMNKSIGL